LQEFTVAKDYYTEQEIVIYQKEIKSLKYWFHFNSFI
jgi:hypothetical protein